MSRSLLIALAVIAIPLVVTYMWVRHPVLCWREMRKSWMLVFCGKDIE